MNLLSFIFGCHHDWGWPHRELVYEKGQKRTYGRRVIQTCVECGTEREYDWFNMRPGETVKRRAQFKLAVSE